MFSSSLLRVFSLVYFEVGHQYQSSWLLGKTHFQNIGVGDGGCMPPNFGNIFFGKICKIPTFCSFFVLIFLGKYVSPPQIWLLLRLCSRMTCYVSSGMLNCTLWFTVLPIYFWVCQWENSENSQPLITVSYCVEPVCIFICTDELEAEQTESPPCKSRLEIELGCCWFCLGVLVGLLSWSCCFPVCLGNGGWVDKLLS